MSSFLYRLGHVMVRRAKRVLALAMLALVLMGALAVGLGGSLQDNLTIPGTESQDGLDVLAQRFPEVAGTSGQILVVAPRVTGSVTTGPRWRTSSARSATSTTWRSPPTRSRRTRS